MRTWKVPLEAFQEIGNLGVEVGILCGGRIGSRNPHQIDAQGGNTLPSQDIPQSSFNFIPRDGVSDAFTDSQTVSNARHRTGREDQKEKLPAQTASFGLNAAKLRVLSQANCLTPAVWAARGFIHRRIPQCLEGTVGTRRLRPLARRRLMTSRPCAVDMRVRKPWVWARFTLLGWYVRFIVLLRKMYVGQGISREIP